MPRNRKSAPFSPLLRFFACSPLAESTSGFGRLGRLDHAGEVGVRRSPRFFGPLAELYQRWAIKLAVSGERRQTSTHLIESGVERCQVLADSHRHGRALSIWKGSYPRFRITGF